MKLFLSGHSVFTGIKPLKFKGRYFSNMLIFLNSSAKLLQSYKKRLSYTHSTRTKTTSKERVVRYTIMRKIPVLRILLYKTSTL